MRQLKEIQDGLDQALRSALMSFKGDRIDKDTVSKVQEVAKETAYDYYKNKITEVEKDMYFINLPKPEIKINGSEITFTYRG